jgi:hypothetical protein
MALIDTIPKIILENTAPNVVPRTPEVRYIPAVLVCREITFQPSANRWR